MINSCIKQGNKGPQGVPGPSLTGSIQGFVALYDLKGNEVYNQSGVLVSLSNSNISTVSDTTGKFELKGVTTGTYDITFTKNGYGLCEIAGYEFVGGGVGSVLFNKVQLSQPPPFYLKSFSITSDSVAQWFTLSGVLNKADSGINYNIVFIGTTPGVSLNPATHSFQYDNGLHNSKNSSTFSGRLPYNTLHSYFVSGTKVYAIAYVLPYNYNSSTSYDPTTGQTIFNALSQTASPVVSFIVP